MREIVAVCRSWGKSRRRTALALDRYLMRIGDRTWRGYASNQCLSRISKDLRASATRSTSVVVHGFAKGRDAERVLFMVGSKRRFDPAGQAPVATSKSMFRASLGPDADMGTRSILRIAAMFHDMGKATNLFQDKLHAAIAGNPTEPDALRHELMSALAWSALVAGSTSVKQRLLSVTEADIDIAMREASRAGEALYRAAQSSGRGVVIPAGFGECKAAQSIGLLILTHHRLPGLSVDGFTPTADEHLNPDASLETGDLDVAPGLPFWHETGWVERLKTEAARLPQEFHGLGISDLHLRSALMMADHYGSAQKSPGGSGHIANSDRLSRGPADSLHRHTERVLNATRLAHDALVARRNQYPGLSYEETPDALVTHEASGRFAWQGHAAAAAGRISAGQGGGFFGCILAGTGTGKTRAAPAVLAGAAFSDPDPERRVLRFTLGLGLRVLTTQSGAEYVNDIGFSKRDVSVMVGSPPLEFRDEAATGSSDMLKGLETTDIIAAGEQIPEEGDPLEADWLKGLSWDTERRSPPFIEALCQEDDLFIPGRGSRLRRLAGTPVLCATIDHVISAASATRSSHLPAALRIITSDLILDEIDQYAAEDLSVIARLAYLVGAAGRRLIVMSATVTGPVAQELHDAYSAGWCSYAATFGSPDHVNAICISDVKDGISTTSSDLEFSECFNQVASAASRALIEAAPCRIAEIIDADLPSSVVPSISAACDQMHERHASDIDGFQVSIGFVRATRIGHVAAIASSLPPSDGAAIRSTICLHSRFPVLLRAWTEHRLKRHLTRKGPDPNSGLRDLCLEEGLFDRAREAGVHEIQIILICSPVIETGNDLDFDYAIIDPSSTRSVVQSAGRVQRHRLLPAKHPNIAVLSRPLVTLFGRGAEPGTLSMPGVETRPATVTGVDRISLGDFGLPSPARDTSSLLGVLGPIDARMVIGEGSSEPLPRAEAELVKSYLRNTACDIRHWCSSPEARFARKQSDMRKFRRSTQTDARLWLSESGWIWDEYSGRREIASVPLHHIENLEPMRNPAFRNITERAWHDYRGDRDMTTSDRRRLLSISYPLYRDEIPSDLSLGFGEDIGMLRSDHLTLFFAD